MRKIDYKKLLTIGDLITLGLVVIGFLIAVFVDMVSMKIIGISLSILGIVRFVMIITYRINLMISSEKLRTTDKSQDYKVTEKKDKKATRVVIEDFHTLIPTKQQDETEKKEDLTKEISGEEGVRLIDDSYKISSVGLDVKAEKTVSVKIDTSQLDNLEYEDEFSGIKIISKEIDTNKVNIVQPLESDITEITETPLEKIKKADKEKIKINEEYKTEKLEIPLSELMETEPAFGMEPRKEFEYLLTRVLKIVRGVTNTKSAVFILVNNDRKELIIEAFDSEVSGKIAARKRLRFGNDIVSQIARSMKPEIVMEISPGADVDLIPYYTSSIGISSFFGMPVFFNNSIIGVLCVDSEETNAYDTSLAGLFGNFAKLIGNLVKSYTAKYDLVQDSRTLSAVNGFREMLDKGNLSLSNLYSSLLSSTYQIFDNSVTGVIGFDSDKNEWFVINTKSNNYKHNITNDLVVSHRSLISESINNDRIIVNVPNLSEQVRINENEIKLDSGFFISIPLKSYSGNYGALFIEGANSADVTSYEVNILKTLASHAGSTIEQLHFADMLKKGLLLDPNSGLLNTPAFMRRLNEEVLRSIDFGYPMTLCLIEIDKYKAIDPAIYPERSNIVLQHVLEIIQSKLRPYDLLGRADSKIFGVVLIDIAVKDAKHWAERLRNEIAISIVKIRNDSFNVTISVGVAQLGKDEALEDVFSNAKEMLRLSLLKANTVTVFE